MASTRFIFGFHAVTSRLRQNVASIKEIYVVTGRGDHRARELVNLAESHAVRVISCDQTRLAAMAGGGRHQGVAACIDATFSYTDIDDVLDALVEPAFLLVLDGIQDPDVYRVQSNRCHAGQREHDGARLRAIPVMPEQPSRWRNRPP